MNQVIIDYRADKETVQSLKGLGFKIIPSVRIGALYSEVDGHPDMQLHFVNGKCICAPEVYKYYSDKLNVELIKGSLEIGSSYPYDICYNVCAVDGFAVCRREYTAPEILSEYKRILNTKQGYAKCSVCVVGNSAAITSDAGIYKLLSGSGIDVLKIRQGSVELYNMGGFIGGASGMLSDDCLAFNGELRTHPDCENIKSFCRDHGVYVTELRKGALKDIGTITLVPKKGL